MRRATKYLCGIAIFVGVGAGCTEQSSGGCAVPPLPEFQRHWCERVYECRDGVSGTVPYDVSGSASECASRTDAGIAKRLIDELGDEQEFNRHAARHPDAFIDCWAVLRKASCSDLDPVDGPLTKEGGYCSGSVLRGEVRLPSVADCDD